MIVGELESEKDGEWLYLRRDEEDYAYVGIRIDKPRIYKPDLRILKARRREFFVKRVDLDEYESFIKRAGKNKFELVDASKRIFEKLKDMQEIASFDYRSDAISKVLLRAVTGVTLIAIGAYLLLQLADAATTIASGTSLGLGYSSLYFSIRKARPFFSKKARETKKSIEEILKEEKFQSKVLRYDSLLNELELKLLSK